MLLELLQMGSMRIVELSVIILGLCPVKLNYYQSTRVAILTHNLIE